MGTLNSVNKEDKVILKRDNKVIMNTTWQEIHNLLYHQKRISDFRIGDIFRFNLPGANVMAYPNGYMCEMVVVGKSLYSRNSLVLMTKDCLPNDIYSNSGIPSMNLENVYKNAGSWPRSYLRDWINTEAISLFPRGLFNMIRQRVVSEYSDGSGLCSWDNFWIPSTVEIGCDEGFERKNNPEQDTLLPIFYDKKFLKKYQRNGNSRCLSNWWTRTFSTASLREVVYVQRNGELNATLPTARLGVVLVCQVY